MGEWLVSTPSGDKQVSAFRMVVTPSGTLIFQNGLGDNLRAFAHGAWLECVQAKQATQGYGG